MYAKRPSSRRRYIAPAIIGAGIGLAGNVFSHFKQKKQRKKAEREAKAGMLNQEIQQDKALIENLELEGEDGIEYYAKGGEIDNKRLIKQMISKNNSISNGGYATKGGKLVPIGDGVELAVGNKHSEKKIDNTYGIKLDEDGDGQAEAEIEDGEVVADGNVVFSDQMMYDKNNSFADKMKKVTNKRNKIEKELDNTTKKIARNTKEKELANLNMAEEALFQKQELAKFIKGEKTLNNLAKGGKIKKYAEGDVIEPNATAGTDFASLAPSLIDNVTNLALTLDTPELPTPVMAKARQLKTDYNVNPQLATVRRTTKAIADNAINNSSSSVSARNAVARAKLAGAEQEGKIYADEENIETQLENQNTLNTQKVGNENTNRVNQNLVQNYQRANDIQSRISANMSNLSKDIADMQYNKKMGEIGDEEVLNEVLNDKTGAKLRAITKNPYFMERVNKDPKLKKAIESLLGNSVINKNTKAKFEDINSDTVGTAYA